MSDHARDLDDSALMDDLMLLLAPRVPRTGQRLIDAPLSADDWAMVWAAHEGFRLICQHIVKRAVLRQREADHA